MKALETEYDGIFFRSRLEARWAILFNSLKLRWVYEPECFILSSGQKYTPDFYIPKFDLYVEIKPNFDWLKDDYHYGRYKEFNKKLLVLSGDYPNFNVNYLINGYLTYDGQYEDCNVVFCPNSKYEPFFYSGNYLGENEDLFEDDYKKELNEVKKHRFWN
jgi:hypothetical protein